jgi:hypothetical protein
MLSRGTITIFWLITGRAFGFGLLSSGNRVCDFAMRVASESVVVRAMVFHTFRSITH